MHLSFFFFCSQWFRKDCEKVEKNWKLQFSQNAKKDARNLSGVVAKYSKVTD